MDDRTQVQWVTLKTEAQLLKQWVARREDVASRRREGPVAALTHRRTLLEREVPRLELEVAALEQALHRGAGARASWAGALLRGVLLSCAAAAWVVGVVTLTPDARADDPVRLLAMLSLVALVALGRVSRGAP